LVANLGFNPHSQEEGFHGFLDVRLNGLVVTHLSIGVEVSPAAQDHTAFLILPPVVVAVVGVDWAVKKRWGRGGCEHLASYGIDFVRQGWEQFTGLGIGCNNGHGGMDPSLGAVGNNLTQSSGIELDHRATLEHPGALGGRGVPHTADKASGMQFSVLGQQDTHLEASILECWGQLMPVQAFSKKPIGIEKPSRLQELGFLFWSAGQLEAASLLIGAFDALSIQHFCHHAVVLETPGMNSLGSVVPHDLDGTAVALGGPLKKKSCISSRCRFGERSSLQQDDSDTGLCQVIGR
jgi:hypothetical protein